MPGASVVIDNFNYERFVADAIESALAQTHPDCEVVVVDDGSTDGSREVIDRYRHRVRAVYKDNGGQASAVNAGFGASRGDIVCFLDADDVLEPGALEAAAEALTPGTSQVHWPLWQMGADGERSGGIEPGGPLPEGDLATATLREGPLSHTFSPMSGNAFARAYLSRVLPMPEKDFRLFADAYLVALAPIYGRIARLTEPQTGYRQHGASSFAGAGFELHVRSGATMTERLWALLSEHAAALGLETDASRWPRHSWWHRLAGLLEDVPAVIDPAADFVLIDDDVLALTWSCSRARPFIERDGVYWGPPDDDATAVAELTRMRQAGARYVVVLWPSFWWLDEYPALRSELDRATTLLDDERVKVFDFEPGAATR